MQYRFVLEKGRSIPLFRNNLGHTETDLSLCLDTGCGLTTFYMSYNVVKMLYPDIGKTRETVTFINANGTKDKQSVYVIPEFILTDKDNKQLHIKNMYCCINDINMSHIDILLSGSIFFNTSIIVRPVKKGKPDSAYRAFIVDTYENNRDTLIMQQQINENDKFYIGALQDIQ